MAHRNSRTALKWAMRIVLSLFFALSIVNSAFYFTGHWQGTLLSALQPLGLALFWILFLWLLPHWTARNQFTKQPSAQGGRTLTVDMTGMTWNWDGGHAEIEWKNLIRYVESKDLFLIYSSPACFNIIPKRSLDSENSSQLRSLLGQNIKGSR